MRAASLGLGGHDAVVLRELGLAGVSGLNEQGRRFDDAYWVYNDRPAARAIWVGGLLGLPAVQALMQGVHGRGAVTFAGVHHLLARHGIAHPAGAGAVRTLLKTLNSAGIAAYSNKLQTVRILAPVPEEIAAVLRVVEPERPYSNLLALREVLRACEGFIYWADPHLPRKALEPLSYEADTAHIAEIKLLSGDANIDNVTRKDFTRFAAEMANRGIIAEWRTVPTRQRDWHDRFILGRRQAWNVPPLNTLLKGDYSELSRTSVRPPFDRWWQTGVALGA